MKDNPSSTIPLLDKAQLAKKARTGEASIAEKREANRAAWARRPTTLLNTHRVFLGDARLLRTYLPDTDVHLVVTSPPYWDLKTYHHDRENSQLGHLHDRQEFLHELAKVWRECYSLLVPGGRLCVVVGDVCRARRRVGRHFVEPLHAYIQVQCQEIGFDPLAPIIWNKISNMATEVSGNGSGFLGKPYEPNAVIKNDIEYILIFRKPGGYRHPTQEQRDLSLISKDDHQRWFRQVWNDIPGEAQRLHPAPFPVELARRLIGMFSFVGDCVLDPFWGVGSLTAAALQMHRSSIGIEIEPEYIKRARQRFHSLPFEGGIEFPTGAPRQ